MLAIIVGAMVVATAIRLAVTRRRMSAANRTPTDASPTSRRAEPTPMTGLEDALNQATDRTGTTLAARLDAEGTHVDELRVGDDTGPLLRRALDHVDRRDGADGDEQPRDATHGEPDQPDAADA